MIVVFKRLYRAKSTLQANFAKRKSGWGIHLKSFFRKWGSRKPLLIWSLGDHFLWHLLLSGLQWTFCWLLWLYVKPIEGKRMSQSFLMQYTAYNSCKTHLVSGQILFRALSRLLCLQCSSPILIRSCLSFKMLLRKAFTGEQRHQKTFHSLCLPKCPPWPAPVRGWWTGVSWSRYWELWPRLDLSSL